MSKKKLNVRVMMLIDEKGMTLRLDDSDSQIEFLELKMSPEALCSAMGRMGHIKAESCEVWGLDNVGKMHEMENIEFKVYDIDESGVSFGFYGKKRKELACKVADELCPEGWTASHYFDSRDSFFRKGEELWARTHIFRWVAKDDSDGS